MHQLAAARAPEDAANHKKANSVGVREFCRNNVRKQYKGEMQRKLQRVWYNKSKGVSARRSETVQPQTTGPGCKLRLFT
jgi:hypothetical protein